MTEPNETAENQSWPTKCETCGTELQRGTVDMDKTNADHPVFRPGEMAAEDFCPNPDCPAHKPTGQAGADPVSRRGAESGGATAVEPGQG